MNDPSIRKTDQSGQIQPSLFPMLRPYSTGELVIGLVAAIGTDLDTVRQLLGQCLSDVGYKVFEVRMTRDVIPLVADIVAHNPNDFEARTTAYMNAGNAARERTNEHGILALGAATRIAALRKDREETVQGESAKRAYIISSVKHPAEVNTLRMIYPEGFYLIGVHQDKSDRREFLIHQKQMAPKCADSLIKRDEEELDGGRTVKHGQQVTETFHLSDFFIRLSKQKNDGDTDGQEMKVRNSLSRVVNLLFGNHFLTPTFDEFAMYMAFAASLRSADLSRQVGAVIARDGQVLATGANDCPRFGGGLYWPEVNQSSGECEDARQGRDFKRGGDSNVFERVRIIDQVLAMADGVFQEAIKSNPSARDAFHERLKGGQLDDLTEYGRVVHAEMEALLSCARAGISPKHATVYGTTFPCHNCAKHIIAAGITRVVYIQPYQKSKAFEFHDEAIKLGFQGDGAAESKVIFEPFVGVGPRRFFDLFSTRMGSGRPLTRKAKGTGKNNPFELDKSTLRLQMLPYSYKEVEEEAAASFSQYVTAKGAAKHAS